MTEHACFYFVRAAGQRRTVKSKRWPLFGIFIVVMVEIALITPPIGINVYVMHNLAPDVELVNIFKGVMPFVLVSLIFVVLLAAFPEMVLFLVDLSFSN